MAELKIAIIGGTGVYNQSLLDEKKDLCVETAYGPVELVEAWYRDRRVYFLARHGGDHGIPPHRVNYRANIAALKKLDVQAVLATAAVGTLRREMPPGSRVIIDQFIDLTRMRPATFFEAEGGQVIHVDFTEPYCPELRALLLKAGADLGQLTIDGGCYVCTEGPRFETPAEIKMIDIIGGDLVGMTNVPEVVLAREAGLCYAALALPSNYAAGITKTPLSHREVLEELKRDKPAVDLFLARAIELVNPSGSCSCGATAKIWLQEHEASGND